MIGNELVTGLVAGFIGYMLGSIPTAYIVARIKTGKDIRKMGGGNVGSLNTFKEVGVIPAIIVAVFDVGKGAAVIAITHDVLDLPQIYVLISALAVVIGHNWMVWLKFTGGKGMGAAIGTLLVILPVYGYAFELAILCGIILVLLILTRNVALSNGVGLLALPFLSWLVMHSGLLVAWSVLLGLIIAAKFTPTAVRALRKSSNVMSYIRGS